MEWMLMPLKRYADFSGRSRRKEYWMFFLGVFIVYAIVMGLIFAGIGASAGQQPGAGIAMFSGGLGIVLLLFALAIFIPALAVQVRRFHDQDKSGWFVLLNLIPYLGGLIVLVMMCLDGTKGPNRFGPDPKGTDHNEVFS